MTPTARTLAALRVEGWTAEVVERWNPHARVRHDLFNVADILAVRGAETLAVQVTSGSNVPARVRSTLVQFMLTLVVGRASHRYR
ncbi:MAG TPA: hypothetical protein VF292_07505 [Rhodanobacteraceae bacterium]